MIQNTDPILPHTRNELYQLLVEGHTRGFNRSIADVKSDLLRPIPSDFISQKPVFEKGSKTGKVPFISWTDCLMILDYLCPEYDYEVSENQLGDRAVVKGRLTLHCKERDLIAEALGSDDLSDTAYGGAVPDASAMALRRCAATLGLARYLYYKEDRTTTPTERNNKKVIPIEEIAQEKAKKVKDAREKYGLSSEEVRDLFVANFGVVCDRLTVEQIGKLTSEQVIKLVNLIQNSKLNTQNS